MMSETTELPIRRSGIAAVLVKKVDGEDCVLLLKRASRTLNGAWCYIGGGIEPGEKAWQAAKREIWEETGIDIRTLYTGNTFDQFYSPATNDIYMAPVFVGFVEDDQDVMLNREHSEYEWLRFPDAMERATLPGNDVVLAFVEKHFVKKAPLEWLRIELVGQVMGDY
ncbi:NUDIX domain-containing protein [Rossellomorea sp. RS05]|uniref:NUDIX hydrolase n=1 Tax=Rossellomorea sp. RS05 TaxID=3149166 RepID=UPI00322187CC